MQIGQMWSLSTRHEASLPSSDHGCLSGRETSMHQTRDSTALARWKPHNAAFVTRRTTDGTCSTANTMKLSLHILRRSLAKSVRKLSPPQNWPWSIPTPQNCIALPCCFSSLNPLWYCSPAGPNRERWVQRTSVQHFAQKQKRCRQPQDGWRHMKRC